MRDYPKPIKRALREWSAEAHERELHRELEILDSGFADWRSNKIGSGELSIRIHEYDTGSARELFKKYNHNSPDINVAFAIQNGILSPEEVPADIIVAIQHLLDILH